MAYHHDICLMQEVLSEYCADINGFIYRNYVYPGIEMPEQISAYKKEVVEIKNSLFPQQSIEPLQNYKKRLEEIYNDTLRLTPEPHK